MILQELKQEAREELETIILDPANNRFEAVSKSEKLLGTLIEKVLYAVEASIVPDKRKRDPESETIYQTDGYNRCQREVVAAFDKFRGT